MDEGEAPDETIPPETDETASEEPVQPEADASVDVQATSQIIASETSTAYSYIYASGKLLQEKVTTNGTTETHNFFYDNTGKPYAMQVNGTTYYYVTNLQGDVMGLVDTSGNSVASYTYDPYGKLRTATGELADKNPLRYRGYYYDSESSLYYLQSRYYDPATRRFVNADSYASTGQGIVGYNSFIYCNNNPVNYTDEDGDFPQAVLDKMVHDRVLGHIVTMNPNLTFHETCVYYNGEDWKGGWGFCDLYNKKTGEVWELKKNSKNRSCTAIRAKAQLNRYISGRLKHNKDLPLKLPEETIIAAGSFTFTAFGYEYNVMYWNEGEGILRYDYTRKKTDGLRAAEAVVTIAVLGTIAIAAPALGPGLAGVAMIAI